MNKNILITLPYSFSYRNIVLTGVLEQLLLIGCKVTVAMPAELCIEGAVLQLLQRYPDRLKVTQITRPPAYSIPNLLFTICAALMFKIQGTYSYQIKRENSKYGKLKPFIKLYLIPFCFPKSKKLFAFFRWCLLKSLKNRDVEKLFDEVRPDIVFTTLNNKVNEYYYLGFAYANRIDTISLVHSWDVITTKGCFVLPGERVLVWNEINEMEYQFLVNRLFGFKTSIHKVGIPQFDIYKTELLTSDIGSIKEKLQVPLNKEVVVYASSVKVLYPNEKEIVQKLIFDFESGFFPGKFLYIRLHPQEFSTLYEDVAKIGVNYRLSIPEKNNSDIEDSVKFHADTLLNLFNDLYVADVIVSMASSISLDAAAIGKNVVNLAFDSTTSPNNEFHQSVERYYYTDHFSKVMVFGENEMARSYDDLKEFLSQNLKNHCPDARGLKERYVYDFGNSVSNIVARIVDE